jgi:hypothetical protein
LIQQSISSGVNLVSIKQFDGLERLLQQVLVLGLPSKSGVG